MKFSHTERGTLGPSQDISFHARSCDSVFCSCLLCNSFWRYRIGVVVIFLNLLVGIYSISVSFGYVVNKVLLHCCVADKMHFSVRELGYFDGWENETKSYPLYLNPTWRAKTLTTSMVRNSKLYSYLISYANLRVAIIKKFKKVSTVQNVC